MCKELSGSNASLFPGNYNITPKTQIRPENDMTINEISNIFTGHDNFLRRHENNKVQYKKINYSDFVNISPPREHRRTTKRTDSTSSKSISDQLIPVIHKQSSSTEDDLLERRIPHEFRIDGQYRKEDTTRYIGNLKNYSHDIVGTDVSLTNPKFSYRHKRNALHHKYIAHKANQVMYANDAKDVRWTAPIENQYRRDFRQLPIWNGQKYNNVRILHDHQSIEDFGSGAVVNRSQHHGSLYIDGAVIDPSKHSKHEWSTSVGAGSVRRSVSLVTASTRSASVESSWLGTTEVKASNVNASLENFHMSSEDFDGSSTRNSQELFSDADHKLRHKSSRAIRGEL